MSNRLQYREHLLSIFDTAVRAVAPDGALMRNMRLEGDKLYAGERVYDLAKFKRIFVLGGGKGAAPMAKAIEELFGERLADGMVVVKYDHTLPLKHIGLMEASHPVPDASGEKAAAKILEMAQQAGEGDLVICVFTGGASALTPAPAEGITLEDIQKTTSALLSCGATIHELNAVRKHLGRFGGGMLAKAAYPAEVLSLIVSDVIGDDLSVIASGPTAPDPSSFADCDEIIKRFGIADKLPLAVAKRLADGLKGLVDETPKPGDPLFAKVHNILAATNHQALEAAWKKAEEFGYAPRIITEKMMGEAREQAEALISEARAACGKPASGSAPLCLLAGGETTVSIRGKGKGGRNQEMALKAALCLEGDSRICGLFAGTDGTDGPTDAAGGFAFADSVALMKPIGDPNAYLDDNNSYVILKGGGDLLITGPTLTNVMDLAIILVNK